MLSLYNNIQNTIEFCKQLIFNNIELMIDLGANDWNRALESACENGNYDAVELMIEKGVTRCNCGRHIYNHIL